VRRPNEREFLKLVLDSVPDLPRGFADSLLEIVEKAPDDRSLEIQRLIEESTRE
jgi:hypothetical protein